MTVSLKTLQRRNAAKRERTAARDAETLTVTVVGVAESSTVSGVSSVSGASHALLGRCPDGPRGLPMQSPVPLGQLARDERVSVNFPVVGTALHRF